MRTEVAVLGVLLTACGLATQPNLDEEFDLKVGERATLTDVSLFVRFIEVSGDSRCPLRAQCVWAGDAAVLLETAPLAGDAMTDTLHTNSAMGPDTLDLGTAALRLVRLDPYPETPGSIPQDQYVVRLIVEAR